jgi:cell division protease FtsH
VNKIMKNVALWLVIAFLLVALFNLFENSSRHGAMPAMAYSDFVAEVDKGRVTDVLISGKALSFHLADGQARATIAPDDPGLIQRLLDKKVRIQSGQAEEDAPSVISILVSWLPLLVMFGFWFYFLRQVLRQMQMLNETVGRIAFNQVPGTVDAKQETVKSPKDEAAG